MNNKYVQEVIYCLQNRKENIIMIDKNQISSEEAVLLSEMALHFKKTIIFSSMKDIVFNKENNVYIIK